MSVTTGVSSSVTESMDVVGKSLRSTGLWAARAIASTTSDPIAGLRVVSSSSPQAAFWWTRAVPATKPLDLHEVDEVPELGMDFAEAVRRGRGMAEQPAAERHRP